MNPPKWMRMMDTDESDHIIMRVADVLTTIVFMPLLLLFAVGIVVCMIGSAVRSVSTYVEHGECISTTPYELISVGHRNRYTSVVGVKPPAVIVHPERWWMTVAGEREKSGSVCHNTLPITKDEYNNAVAGGVEIEP